MTTAVSPCCEPPAERNTTTNPRRPSRDPADESPAPLRSLGESLLLGDKATKKPARKRATTSVPAQPVTEPKSTRRELSDTQEHELVQLNAAALAAVEAFEARVVELITLGVSPTTIGKAIDRGNSSVRRIAMRRAPGLVK
jgi:hypothetical protein